MRDCLFRRGLVVGIIMILFCLSVIPIIEGNQSLTYTKIFDNEGNVAIDMSVYGEPGKKLTSEHISYLQRPLPNVRDHKVKQIVESVIAEILDDGDATSGEIQKIVESSNVDIPEVYINAEIVTTEETDGGLICIPGQLRSLFGFIAKGIFVMYRTGGIPPHLYGWHLHINGHLVSEKTGYIFGYFGYAENIIRTGFEEIFFLNGFGVLIIHGISSSGNGNAQQYSNLLLLRFLEHLCLVRQRYF